MCADTPMFLILEMQKPLLNLSRFLSIMNTKDQYLVVGCMSGTSLDGLDIALLLYRLSPLSHRIIRSKTIPYQKDMRARLGSAHTLSALQFLQFQLQYSKWHAKCINQFLVDQKRQVHLIAMHGHTVIHTPPLTYQIGRPAVVAALTRIPTVGNFRLRDCVLGFEGAPLAPFAEELYNYEVMVNMGGICNIGVREQGGRRGWDVCFCNMIGNELTGECDWEGQLGRGGVVDERLLERMESNMSQFKGKSLSRESFEQFKVCLGEQSLRDKLRTAYQHIASRLAEQLNRLGKTALVTGGGSHNKFLMELIRKKSTVRIVELDAEQCDMKESVIFGWLGLKRLLGMSNCQSGVSGELCV